MLSSRLQLITSRVVKNNNLILLRAGGRGGGGGCGKLTSRRNFAGGHDHHHHQPVPQSSKAVLFEGQPTNEGWETSVKFWYTISFGLICIILSTSPDTDIQAWAQKEATSRLHILETTQGSGTVKQEFIFGNHYQEQIKNQQRTLWDKFSTKALKMNDEDDDDDEEEEGEGEDKAEEEEEDEDDE